NQVWAMDITYVPMARGFIYLVAVMDWFSRRVLSWRVSITMEAAFCIEALEEALMTSPGLHQPGHSSVATQGAFHQHSEPGYKFRPHPIYDLIHGSARLRLCAVALRVLPSWLRHSYVNHADATQPFHSIVCLGSPLRCPS